MLLYPTLDHDEQFARSFVKIMSNKVEVSMLWGLLSLVIKLSLESQGMIDQVADMLKRIGHKSRRLNQCAQTMPTGYSQIMGDATEIHREMIFLWLNVISLFRNQTFDTQTERTIQSLTDLYDKAMSHISDPVVRIEKIVEMAERQMRLMDMEIFQKLLSRNQDHDTEKGQVPCFNLLIAENKRFFGREDVLSQLEDHLQPSSDASGIRSVALWGLGGVGKTQTALAYAYSKRGHLDAVFWISAESKLSLLQGFSRFAIDALKIPGANIGAHQENTILVETC
jgi:hypothetical protein